MGQTLQSAVNFRGEIMVIDDAHDVARKLTALCSVGP